jgi:hypothetical protein
MLLRVPGKLLKYRTPQICQGSGVGSIPIGRSINFKHLRRSLFFCSSNSTFGAQAIRAEAIEEMG